GWAVKINASITFIEYTLTFLVSMAALVTFIADRLPILNEAVYGIQYRTFVAIFLSILTGWLVNRGPKMAARAFGPATAAVLLLLWVMVIATIWKLGFHLPSLTWQAFSSDYIGFTFGGYARILAVMTGIEIFANLVAAYDGPPQQKASKSFGSLLIIMGTTSVTMLVVGPAIFQLADPTLESVSVFTQTMDLLLPAPLPYVGTLIGIAVLLSASAASAQGLQNLFLGLRYRHYIPAVLGQRNQFEVADKPVWIEVAIVAICFLFFGTDEETYLAIYAAGVFILLSMTGWAAAKRLIRQMRTQFTLNRFAALGGTAVAALLTSGATIIIFYERFAEGAWTYFILIPILYMLLTFFRRRLGDPTPVAERLGRLIAERRYVSAFQQDGRRSGQVTLENIVVPLDGSAFAEQALPLAQMLCHTHQATLTLVSVEERADARRLIPHPPIQSTRISGDLAEREDYLSQVAWRMSATDIRLDFAVSSGTVANEINTLAHDTGADLIVMSTHGRSGLDRWLIGSAAHKLIQISNTPLLLIRPGDEWRSRGTLMRRLLVTLDGSKVAEEVLPYAKALASRLKSEILLLSVPAGFGTEVEIMQMREYLDGVATNLRAEGLQAQAMVTGSAAAQTIVHVSESERVDLIMLATRGAGGMDRFMIGSTTDRVVRHTQRPVFLVPVRRWRGL
ncbi:MAG: universal stress protein, partial [Anaerolineales bacterium]|nr:universal stress protein [Anaerolineales bacterium]